MAIIEFWGARPLPSIRQTVMIFQGDVDNQTAENIPSLPPSIWSLMARPRPRFSSMTGPTAMRQPPSALPVCLLRPSAKRAPKSRQDPKDRRAAARSVRCGQQLEFSRDFAYSGERKSPDVVAATSPPQIGWKIKIRIRWWRRTVYVLLRSYFERGA